MELPSEEGEMPIPLNTSYGHVGHAHGGHRHMIMTHHDHASHNHILASPETCPDQIPPINVPIPPSTHHDHVQLVPFKKIVHYKECLKNHAASMGGNATDGCGEFMPNGEHGTLEALTCSACNCHRNFHRKETEGEASSYENHHHNVSSRNGKNLFLGNHHRGYYGKIIVPYNMDSLPADETYEGVRLPAQIVNKKRHRTKFSQEQKEKMMGFADKVGWKLQKGEEDLVQQFCQEVGIKRRVLKVWMHNNKHNLAKKIYNSNGENQV